MTNFKVLMHDNKFVAEIGTMSACAKIIYTPYPRLYSAGETMDSVIKKNIESQPHWSREHKKFMIETINECTLELYVLCTTSEYML